MSLNNLIISVNLTPMENLTKQARFIFHKTLRAFGVLFLFAGLLGLVFPLIPGIPLLILGIIILGEESIFTGWIMRFLPERLKNKIKKLRGKKKEKTVESEDANNK